MIDPQSIRHPMEPEQLEAVAIYLVGRRKWPACLGAILYCGEQTVRNWFKRRAAIPGPAVAALRLLVERKQLKDMLG